MSSVIANNFTITGSLVADRRDIAGVSGRGSQQGGGLRAGVSGSVN